MVFGGDIGNMYHIPKSDKFSVVSYQKEELHPIMDVTKWDFANVVLNPVLDRPAEY